MKITKDMKIIDVLKKHPWSKAVFEKYLPACVTCGGASAESIERGAKMHGVDPDAVVRELNSVARTAQKQSEG